MLKIMFVFENYATFFLKYAFQEKKDKTSSDYIYF